MKSSFLLLLCFSLLDSFSKSVLRASTDTISFLGYLHESSLSKSIGIWWPRFVRHKMSNILLYHTGRTMHHSNLYFVPALGHERSEQSRCDQYTASPGTPVFSDGFKVFWNVRTLKITRHSATDFQENLSYSITAKLRGAATSTLVKPTQNYVHFNVCIVLLLVTLTSYISNPKRRLVNKQ